MNPVVDPAMQAILEVMRQGPAIDLRALCIVEARASFETQQIPWSWSPEPMAEVREIAIPTQGALLRARLYLPVRQAGLPVVIFAHGGGWTFGSVNTHDGTMRMLASASGAAVLGIDYRLAPEHPFPAPLEDILSALAFAEAGKLGVDCDASRIALAGDSAGANLALGAMVARRDLGGPVPLTAALFYGCYAPVFDTDSHARLGDGTYLLRSEMMRWYWTNFLGPLAPEQAPATCAPLTAELAGLPPLYLNAAGLDPLLDDTMMLSRKLAEAGVRHRLDVWPGVVHGFLRLARELPAARSALTEAGQYLKQALNQ